MNENEDTSAHSLGEMEKDDDNSMDEEEGEEEMNERLNAIEGKINGDYGEELFEKDESEVEEYMQDMEENEIAMDDLKMPGDLEGEDDDDDEEEGEDEMDENQEDGDGDVDQVFEDAAEHGEMDIIKELKKQKAEESKKESGFINTDLINKIDQIEDEMMNPKEWQMTGEAFAKDRPANSLLQVHLDFNTATRLPPTITKETTNKIEDLIKQRVLDELFDDPVLRRQTNKRQKDAYEMDFTKNKKGLGDLY